MGLDSSIFFTLASGKFSASGSAERSLPRFPDSKNPPEKVISIDAYAGPGRREAVDEAQRLTSAARRSAAESRDSGASRLRAQGPPGPQLVPALRRDGRGATFTATRPVVIDGVFVGIAMAATATLLWCAW